MTPSADFPTRNLAAAAVAGDWAVRSLAARFRAAAGTRGRWAAELARRLLDLFPTAPADEAPVLEAFTADARCLHLLADDRRDVRRLFWMPARMGPGRGWDVPPFRTTGELADWLGVTPGELDWLADAQGRNGRQPEPRLRHYTSRWVPKRGGRFRLIEVPKPRLKAIQRRILHEILDRIPPHPAAHGFRRGRSVRTFVDPHVGRATVWRVDLKDFFPSLRPSRIHALFRTAGYPAPVCRVLTGLCTTSLPADVRPPAPDVPVEPYRSRHLPQGAPTSPALANLAAYRLDLRLNSWAAAAGMAYTRYADDLAFSGDLDRRFRAMVWQIILAEGFRPNAAKSRWMTRAGRQHLGGVVVNVRPNVVRAEYDELKAILTNCARHGPASQNRTGASDFRAHLIGRIAHVVSLNPGRLAKLCDLIARVKWDG
jgi:RNA-directed DNA polymerase